MNIVSIQFPKITIKTKEKIISFSILMIFMLSLGLQETHKLSHNPRKLSGKKVIANCELTFSSQIENTSGDDSCQQCDAIKKLNIAKIESISKAKVLPQSIELLNTYTNNYSFSIYQTVRNKAPPVC